MSTARADDDDPGDDHRGDDDRPHCRQVICRLNKAHPARNHTRSVGCKAAAKLVAAHQALNGSCESHCFKDADCTAPNACESAHCDTSNFNYACEVAAIDPSKPDACGGACTNTQSDVFNCGGCGTVCPASQNETAACSGGVCGQSCQPGFADCDHNPANGCEVSTQTDVNNCGACGTVCQTPANASTEQCIAGACAPVCNTGFAASGNTCVHSYRADYDVAPGTQVIEFDTPAPTPPLQNLRFIFASSPDVRIQRILGLVEPVLDIQFDNASPQAATAYFAGNPIASSNTTSVAIFVNNLSTGVVRLTVGATWQ